nr:cytidylate kinase-like family protein [Actinomycetales bacterium]
MPSPVVTIFESFGAGASTIGPAVADALGVPFLGQHFSTDELMTAVHTQRPADESVVDRLLGRLGRAAAQADLGVFSGAREEYDVACSVAELKASVAQGGVVLGRNATVILATTPGALHVRLDGPLERRAERVARAQGADFAEMEARAVRDESLRAEMSLRLFNWDPRNVDRYDLVLNSTTLGADLAVDVIVAAWRLKAARAAQDTSSA